MKKVLLAFLLIISQILYVYCQEPVLFQYSTFNALAGGLYDGDLTIGELLKKGDHGLGTFNELNGELIILEGKCYRAKVDSSGGRQVEVVGNQEKTPFAEVVKFNPDTFFFVKEGNKHDLDSLILNLVPKNGIYALRLDGEFKNITYRSVAEQQKPYPKLADAVKFQTVFTAGAIKGTLVGFYFPDYMKELNVNGFHWHFISADRTQGGHLMNFEATGITVKIASMNKFSLQLLQNSTFLSSDFKTTKDETDLIEKGTR